MKLFRVKNTYAPSNQRRLACVKSSFPRESSDRPSAIDREALSQLTRFQIRILFLGIPIRFPSKTPGGVNTTGFNKTSSRNPKKVEAERGHGWEPTHVQGKK